ncbi:MAG: ABC transporter permease [Candidatus Fimenecus sp.]
MYIIKNALKCISRSKGRNILIGVIVFVIAVSACVGLSIRQAAEHAKNDTLENLTVTATISFDRQSMMSELRNGGTAQTGNGKFDKGQFSALMEEASSLSLAEYLKYAEAESVKDFYYSETVSMNGSDALSPVTSDTTETSSSGNLGNAKGGMMGGYSAADFQVIGYSDENAMTSFRNGTACVTEGTVFEAGTEKTDCLISEELAAYNDITVGDTITLTNPSNAEEMYTLCVVGLYTDTAANESVFTGRGMPTNDPANKIYMSYTALQSILSASNEGTADSTALTGTIAGTYVFADTDAYYRFEEEVRELGLEDSYTVSSADLAAFENSLTPLNTLSKTAGWFLLVILVIGAIILVVLNIFNVRERKYEIGVLTAMGMSKGKVALQFLTEIFVVTLAAVVIGAGIGAVTSVPITNALLENQVEAQAAQSAQIEENFGRGNKAVNENGLPDGSVASPESNYVTEISTATNLTVILQMLGIAILLTLISGAVSMLFIMRYEPLKILANRD